MSQIPERKKVNTLLPWPQKIDLKGERLIFQELPQVIFEASSTPRLHLAADRYLTRLKRHQATGIATIENVTIHQRKRIKVRIIYTHRASEPWPALTSDESYKLEVNSEGVTLESITEWGILHGLETLSQTMQQTDQGWSVPTFFIEDKPAYLWRGLCLDVCRHWIGPSAIHRILDGMATEHLNVLHLHLSDDQAFRLALSGISTLGNAGTNKISNQNRFSQNDIASLVDHAANLGIRLIPEIDLPGHTTALLALYPELAVEPKQYEPSNNFGGHEGCIDPTRESTYKILTQLLTEVAQWFPDQYVHLGGDEVNESIWLNSKHIQDFIAQRGWRRAGDLQAYFNRKLSTILTQLNKTMVLWDEALHPDLPRETVIQCWRGVAARDLALAQQHRVIFSSGYYLDLNYSSEVHYRFDPGAPSEVLRQAEEASLQVPGLVEIRSTLLQFLTAAKFPTKAPPMSNQAGHHVLGGEACLWSELVDEACLDTRLFSRLPAIAERLWLGQAANHHSTDLYQRLAEHWQYLEQVTVLQPLTSVPARLAEFVGESKQLVPELVVLLACLEPVKWYQRVLGQKYIKARANGETIAPSRPYTASTPLNRIVDICPPESFVAHQLNDMLQQAGENQTMESWNGLKELATAWQCQAKVLAGCKQKAIQEVLLLSQQLGFCGSLMQDMIEQVPLSQAKAETCKARLEEMQTISGELRLAVVPPLIAMLDLYCRR